MNRFVFGRGWVLCDETDGQDNNGGVGGGASADDVVDDGDTVVVDDEAGGEKPAAKKEGAADEPKDMQTAIDVALGYKRDTDGNRLDAAGNITHDKDGKAIEPKPAAPKPPTDGKENETHHANGKPKKDATGQALDADGKVVKAAAPAKAKTAAELALKPEEMKGLHAKTQARFSEVITTLKAHETTIARQTESIKVLTEARDTILGVLEETNTTQDELGAYLEFNALLKSKDPKSLESALGMIENQRAVIYKALGREPADGGVDLLAEFPDLQQKVTEAQMTREDALELANSRREKAQRDAAARRAAEQNRTETQTAEQKKQAETTALTSIETWTKGLETSDLDYSAKEAKLLAKVPDVIKNYAPALWLPTLKMLYEGIVITKAQPAPGAGHRPLRPSGAKPGDKKPADMLEAINQGLGYAGAAKG